VERGICFLQARSEPVGTSTRYRMMGWVHTDQRGWIEADGRGLFVATEFHCAVGSCFVEESSNTAKRSDSIGSNSGSESINQSINNNG
jgi:hypothetical protein